MKLSVWRGPDKETLVFSLYSGISADPMLVQYIVRRCRTRHQEMRCPFPSSSCPFSRSQPDRTAQTPLMLTLSFSPAHACSLANSTPASGGDWGGGGGHKDGGGVWGRMIRGTMGSMPARHVVAALCLMRKCDVLSAVGMYLGEDATESNELCRSQFLNQWSGWWTRNLSPSTLLSYPSMPLWFSCLPIAATIIGKSLHYQLIPVVTLCSSIRLPHPLGTRLSYIQEIVGSSELQGFRQRVWHD